MVVETVEDERTRAQHFTVDTLDEGLSIRSLVLVVNQTHPNAHVSLYINCVSQGKIATPRSMRDMFSRMKNPELQVVSKTFLVHDCHKLHYLIILLCIKV